MLSPLKWTAPSTSLLRFLRSQSGIACPSALVCSRLGTRCYETSATRPSRRSSTCVIQDKSCCSSSYLTRALNFSDVRPKLSNLPVATESSIFVRHTSTTRQPLLRRLFDLRRNKVAESKNCRNKGPGVIDDATDGIFNIGRGLAAKASNELRIRCTEFDNNGNVTLMNGEFRKLELIAKVSEAYL